MNPFSGFLQPPQQRSPLAGAGEFVNQMAQMGMARKAQAQQALQAQDSSARDWKRIGLQETAQNRNFSEADKKEVESLLAEYQDAEDQGDAVRLDRASQMLKRFGMDVAQGGPQKPAPLPGSLLPEVKATAGPIETVERDLPQGDFESQLIAETQSPPSRYEADGQTTPEFLSRLPKVQPGAVEDMGDVDSPEFQAAAEAEATDLGDVDSPEFQRAAMSEAGPQRAPQLPGQLLPTVISKGGKQLYSSTGPSGRWAPMVSGVFEPYANHENPQIAAAARSAQGFAEKLIQVDGMSPAKAIETARDQMMKDAGLQVGLERTKLGTRPRWGGGAGGTGLMGKTQDIAESAQLYDDNARAEAAKIQEEDRQYESIEAAAASGDPALQRDAVNQLLKIRSGSAVTASEDARISQINGLIAQVQDRLGRWTGGSMTPEMSGTIRQIVSLKRQVSQAKIKRIYEHQAKLYEVQNRGKTKDPAVLQERSRVLREGGNVGGAPIEDYSDL